jgi:hypothetical protein
MHKKLGVGVFGMLSFLALNCGGEDASFPEDGSESGDGPAETNAQALTCATSCRIRSAVKCTQGKTAYTCTTTCGYSYSTGCVTSRGSSYCTSSC